MQSIILFIQYIRHLILYLLIININHNHRHYHRLIPYFIIIFMFNKINLYYYHHSFMNFLHIYLNPYIKNTSLRTIFYNNLISASGTYSIIYFDLIPIIYTFLMKRNKTSYML